MNIDETLSYIHAVCWRSSIPGLERIRALLALMGDPQKDMKFIHVTGTNGKGSTCAIMASILRAAGYRTGLYTSPFLIRFNERMQVDGRQITDDELCEITAQVRPLADSLDPHPTEFEMVTAIAFAYFARHNCDIVVCEVGMGGEFDATNVIPAPEAAVFCNIGLDHTQYLGDTIEKIAATKAGIIKPGCDAVLELQREQARRHSVIMDGRDIGTVVLPDATVKIFLTAAPEVRAMRRFRELEQRGTSQPYDQVLREIVDRDYADTHRAIAPLRRAEDAVELDTGALTFEESLHLLLETIRRRAKL